MTTASDPPRVSRRAPRALRVLAQGLAVAAAVAAAGMTAEAADIGQIKVAKGQATIDRGGGTLPAEVGMRVQSADVLRTGADGSIGVTMSDNSLLGIGPNSVLSLDSYEFDATTQQGRFDSMLSKGSLAVISGRIAKQTPDAMKVRTPMSILGVRGTEFAVSADE